ncbi:hypothetical protein EDC01DRAFT_680181 [Geopyxis carbonaria]|nr:hypothetical protein EDC01DRAFT_680181 [Geopyxis carbonaria]
MLAINLIVLSVLQQLVLLEAHAVTKTADVTAIGNSSAIITATPVESNEPTTTVLVATLAEYSNEVITEVLTAIPHELNEPTQAVITGSPVQLEVDEPLPTTSQWHGQAYDAPYHDPYQWPDHPGDTLYGYEDEFGRVYLPVPPNVYGMTPESVDCIGYPSPDSIITEDSLIFIDDEGSACVVTPGCKTPRGITTC